MAYPLHFEQVNWQFLLRFKTAIEAHIYFQGFWKLTG